MDTKMCMHCGSELEKRSFRKYGMMLVVCGILLYPLLFLIAPVTVASEVVLVLFTIVGFYFILKREKDFYFCNRCRKKIK